MGVQYDFISSGITPTWLPVSPLGLLGFTLIAIILLAGWVILAGSRFVQGGVVERPERIPQLYGYTVCMIAVVVGFVSIVSLVANGLALASPAYGTDSEWIGWSEPSVTSFEAFRVSYERTRDFRSTPGTPPPEPLSEDELRRRYEALRADRIERTRVSAQRALVTRGLTLALAIALFAFHWRWLRTRVESLRVASAL